MTKDILLYRKPNNSQVWGIKNLPIYPPKKESQNKVDLKPEILFLTSFPPRECGIATYTQDLIDHLKNQFEDSFSNSICALESDIEKPIYQTKPKYTINTDDKRSFAHAASQINKDEQIKVLVIQHEFGFFTAQAEAFKLFMEQISKPIILVFHTVLPEPNELMNKNVCDLAKRAASIIVMTQNSKRILKQVYKISEEKIDVIPHGTHLTPAADKKNLKEIHHLESKKVLATFGLLGPGKSIETTLDALPEIIKQHPDVVFLILGKTHPTLLNHQGESYRIWLQDKVKELNLETHVRFVNAYLPLPVLLEYLQLSDIYLFTSKDKNQAVSGTFAYAISCGCPVISTPIPHAVEVLNNGNGILFDFEDAGQLAKAVIDLLHDEKSRASISNNSFHKMAETAWQNSAIKHALLFQKMSANPIEIKFSLPKINLNHIQSLTTDFGMIQFSKLSTPDLHSGYTLDDNARALIALCKHYKNSGDNNDLSLIKTYYNFIQFCFQDKRYFLNYVNEKKKFTNQNNLENLEDSTGRAIWALGTLVAMKDILPYNFCERAEEILKNALLHLEEIHSTRAMAFIIKGLYKQDNEETQFLLKTLSRRLVEMYKHTKTENWSWFENYMTYGNSVLPEAMLCAYLNTNRIEYKEIAKESFDFYLSKIFIKDSIRPISNKGWLMKDGITKTEIGGEQPIDVAYTIMALELFYSVFQDETYKEKANIAFSWFIGNNHLREIVYNPCTGGSYDGIEENNVNLNQGAESTVSYLLARLSVESLYPKNASKIIQINNKRLQINQ
jgi:glycosyltransferase involved in cell wall biosynthesis